MLKYRPRSNTWIGSLNEHQVFKPPSFKWLSTIPIVWSAHTWHIADTCRHYDCDSVKTVSCAFVAFCQNRPGPGPIFPRLYQLKVSFTCLKGVIKCVNCACYLHYSTKKAVAVNQLFVMGRKCLENITASTRKLCFMVFNTNCFHTYKVDYWSFTF